MIAMGSPSERHTGWMTALASHRVLFTLLGLVLMANLLMGPPRSAGAAVSSDERLVPVSAEYLISPQFSSKHAGFDDLHSVAGIPLAVMYPISRPHVLTILTTHDVPPLETHLVFTQTTASAL